MLQTQVHQSGDISLRPFTLQQDEMRGMDSSIVGSPDTLAKHFEVSDIEAKSLSTSTLPWLHYHILWYQRYRASYQQIKDVETFLRTRPESGYLLPVLPENVVTDTNHAPHHGVSKDVLGVLASTEDHDQKIGSMGHIRQSANNVLRSTLAQALPSDWSVVCHNSLQYDEDHTASASSSNYNAGHLPQPLHINRSFTKINFFDSFFDARAFVQQHPYGTGCFQSTADSITNIKHYNQCCLEMPDGFFLDTQDCQWQFVHFERCCKKLAREEWKGIRENYFKPTKDTSTKTLYQHQRLSARVGHL